MQVSEAALGKRLMSGRGTPELALREIVRSFGMLERVLHPYFARFGISGAQWGVLRNLHRAEEEGVRELRLTDLAGRLLVRPPSVTGIIDRLERAGLVARGEVRSDLRSKRVSLTGAGRNVVKQVLRGHANRIDALMAGLTAEEQDELRRLLGKLTDHLERLLESGAPAAPPSGDRVRSGN